MKADDGNSCITLYHKSSSIWSGSRACMHCLSSAFVRSFASRSLQILTTFQRKKISFPAWIYRMLPFLSRLVCGEKWPKKPIQISLPMASSTTPRQTPTERSTMIFKKDPMLLHLHLLLLLHRLKNKPFLANLIEKLTRVPRILQPWLVPTSHPNRFCPVAWIANLRRLRCHQPVTGRIKRFKFQVAIIILQWTRLSGALSFTRTPLRPFVHIIVKWNKIATSMNIATTITRSMTTTTTTSSKLILRTKTNEEASHSTWWFGSDHKRSNQ